uniref:Uncharacterized protein n=1 Tax=Rhizophora mucronata TaxID=61149 RepID=A0A2P2Q6S1_RHIMU
MHYLLEWASPHHDLKVPFPTFFLVDKYFVYVLPICLENGDLKRKNS